MQFRMFTSAAFLALGVVATACSSPQPSAQSTTAPATSPSAAIVATPGPVSARTGTFAGLNDKTVSGTAKIADGQLLLSSFSSDAGPDLHIYLTTGTDESAVAAGKELGSISNDKAAQTFSAGDVDVSKYTDVVINCDKAKAVFGAAALS